MADYLDMVLALLPFEAPFFEKYGLHAVFVGHPAIERAKRMTGGEAFRVRHAIAPDAPLLAVLPGSRTGEVLYILPAFRAAVGLLAKRVPGLVTVLPTVTHVAERVKRGTADWPTPLHVVEGEDEKFAAFDAADAALAASGTVTTELALSRTPMVVGYKVAPFTYPLLKPFVHIKFVTIVNLILDREAVPEFLQSRCTPHALADAALPLLTDKAAAARQVADLEEAMRRLGQGAEQPSLRAARAILDFVRPPG
jgi:lipid-A-disaccharide synthase